MKYTIFLLFIQLLFISCAESEYEYNYSQDSIAGQVGMSAVAAVAANDLNINFMGTTCFDTSTGVTCEAPMTRSTSIAGIRHLVTDYLDNNDSYQSVETISTDEITAFYRAPDAAYEVRFIMEFKELKIIITQKEWS